LNNKFRQIWIFLKGFAEMERAQEQALVGATINFGFHKEREIASARQQATQLSLQASGDTADYWSND
jgi:hypothetical protein